MKLRFRGRVRVGFAAFVVAVAAVVVGLEAASANPGARFVVNSTSDALDASAGNGLCATRTGACTLRAAVQEANALPGADLIEVPAGTYELAIPPLNQNDISTGDIDITDSVTISGAGAPSTIVDAGVPLPGAPQQVHGLDRIFEVSVDGGTVNFTGLTLSDGYAAEYGGAIANNSTATVAVAGSILTRNVAGKAGGAIDNHFGGAVEVLNSTVMHNFASENASALNNNRGGRLTVTDSTVSSNSAADVGLDESLVGAGAISNNAELDTIGTIAVSGSTISENRAGGGRAGASIANDGAGTVTVDTTTFSKNATTGDGGAISNAKGEVTVTASTFTENAAHDGGAIHNDGGNDGSVAVRDSSFSLNSASARGGAIEGGGTGLVEVVDSTFSKNSSDDMGGAISSSDKASMSIVRTTFSENSGLTGGGFANEGAGLVTVEDSTFTNNAAFAPLVLAKGEGGGMHSNSGGDVVISGGAFTGNHARSGGGLSNEGGGTLAVTGTRFYDNIADEHGGGILIQSGAIRMVDIDVARNVADSPEEGGGGISYAGDKLVSVGESAAIEDSRIHDNKSKGPGGGVDSRGDGPLALETTSITGNTASIGGGINHVGDATLNVNRSTLSGNFAESGGGVFSDGDGESTVENSTVSTNRAGQFGGGLLVSSRLTLRHSTVAGNSAASGGGVNNGGGDLVGDGTVFLANTIVANSPIGGNCAGRMTSLGGNVDSADTCQLRETSDQPGTDPRLGALANNGGPTQTHALLAGSPAQERAVCTELEPCPPVDQRGVARPLFDGADAGAYESELEPEGGGGQACSGRTERPMVADFDSWVSQAAPSTNFGPDATLKVESTLGANDRALVHFALPPIPPGCKLVGATLRMHSSAATAGRTLQALRVGSAWSELGVTWTNQPATAGPAATTESGLGIREWDVHAQTLDMYALGNHGYLIRDASENDAGEQSFHSTEKAPEQPPELVLVFDDPDNPPPPGPCPTHPQTLAADRDSWVSQGSPSNNFGSDSALKVKSQTGSNSRALVRFPLPTLPSGCTSIASATLKMDAASAKEGRTLQALQVASAWSEAGVTWSNQPATTGRATSVPSASGPLEWTVTPQVLDIYTSANHGFLIRDAQENGVGDEQALQSRDKLGDGAPELVVVFDDSTPETTILTGPSSPTTSTQAAFSFSSDRGDASFECALDGAAFHACSSPHPVGGLAEGDHRLEVRATRKVRAVDPTPASYEWKVAVPPDTTTLEGPGSPSAGTSATLTFAADDPAATFECSLDDAPFAACASPVEYAELADGAHVVRVRATDPFGNVEPVPASHSWTVAVPPVVTIVRAPADPSKDPAPSFDFTATDNGPALPAPLFECQLDGGGWEPCASPHGVGPVLDGPHALDVRATDAGGNVSDTASHRWSVDTSPPVVTLGAAPPDPGNEASPTFEFSSELGARVECSIDGLVIDACGSPQTVGPLPDGGHTFVVAATDAAGNTGSKSHAWTVDTTAPVVTFDSVPADPSNAASPTIAFSTEAGARIACSIDGIAIEACASPQRVGPLPDGRHTVAVSATDAAGNVGTRTHAWTVDTTAPVVTFDSAPADQSNAASPAIEFSTEAGARVECIIDGIAIDPCASPQTVGPLPDGRHTFEVAATDAAGNTGSRSHSWTVDTIPPAVTLGGVPRDPSNAASATLEFSTEAGARVECSIDGIAIERCASPQPVGPLADGTHTFEVRATDAAGNTGPAAGYAWTVDTTPPAVTFHSLPAGLSNEASPAIDFSTEAGAHVECSIDGIAIDACASPQPVGPLDEGTHTFEVTATDTAGNTGTAGYEWTVDTIAPVASFDSAPADPSNAASPTFEFSTEAGARVECSIDRVAIERCASPQPVGPLADGTHTFEVRATDAAGNTGAAGGHTWTIDTVPPDVTLDALPADLSSDAEPSFAFSAEAGAHVTCTLDGIAIDGCGSPQRVGPLPDGPHEFEVTATDAAGNTGTAGHEWTVDTSAPVVSFGSVPANPSNEASPTIEFSAEAGAHVECSLDGIGIEPCASPQPLGPLAEGRHEFEVTATDAAGNTGTAAHAWTVDTTAPSVTLDTVPRDPSSEASPSFGFSTEAGARVECSLDGVAIDACASPQPVGPLGDGTHTFEVSATDAAGNAGTAAYTWTVDTTAPLVTLGSVPTNPSNDPTPSFAFSTEADAHVTCSLDGVAIERCTSPQPLGPLPDGTHTFEVSATDAAGNTGTAAHTWTVDTTAPSVALNSVPADPSNDASPTFTFSADAGARVTCTLDDVAIDACASPQPVGPLADGMHAFEVTATDAAGNSATAGYSWTVATTAPDATPPETTITDKPRNPSSSSSASLAFTGSDNETPAAEIRFECRLDSQTAADFAPCDSPKPYPNLADGSHTFDVRALDAAGNHDPTPASHTWAVDTTAPQTSIDAGPVGLTRNATPTYEFSSEQGASFQCRVDAGSFAACTSPHTTATLADGAHTFEVRATDAAGNTDDTPASRSITVDTTAPQTSIDAGPVGLTRNATPTYEFSSEQGASFQCRVDAGSFAACTSPHTTATLADGAHTFEVRATDAAGNTDDTPASRSITVDTTAPQTSITEAPPATTTSTSARLGFTAGEPGAAFECSLDGAVFTTCTSPRDLAGLSVGTHTFSVRAKDAAGNVDATPASHSWTITAPPQGCGPAATALSVADAWIDENSPSNNKGTDSILKVQSKGPRDNFRALVRFSLPAVPQGCVIESATLRLYAASAKTGRTLHALRVADAWTENQVSWTNQPATTGAVAATASGQGYRDWNVTSHVHEMYAGSNNGFLIRDAVESQDAEQQFHGREKGESPPQLVVRFAAAS